MCDSSLIILLLYFSSVGKIIEDIEENFGFEV